jgi:DNA-binding phage protein
MELDKKVGTQLPSLEPELRSRLSKVIDRLGGVSKAAEAAGVVPDQISRWRDGKAKPNFLNIRQLCATAGVRMDWLSFGQGPMLVPEIDAKMLDEAVASEREGMKAVSRELTDDWSLMNRDVLKLVMAGALGNEYSEAKPFEAAKNILRAYDGLMDIRNDLVQAGNFSEDLWAKVLKVAGLKSVASDMPDKPEEQA